MPTTSLESFIAELRAAQVVPWPPGEGWAEMIARTARAGMACAIDRETFDYFLEVLPPKFMGRSFAFAEGAEALRYFWGVPGGRFFCRQLTWDETREFCRLARIPLPS